MDIENIDITVSLVAFGLALLALQFVNFKHLRLWGMRLKVAWNAHVLGRRVFYAEVKDDEGKGGYYLYLSCEPGGAAEHHKMFNASLAKMGGTVTRRIVR